MLQYERDQQAPEWLDWLAGRDAAVERFLSEDVPEVGVLADPWSVEGLRRTEESARATFGDLMALRRPEHGAAVDRYIRYIGEVYVRTLEGAWHNDSQSGREDHGVGPVIGLPFWMTALDPRQQLGHAFVKPTKRNPLRPEGELAWTHSNAREDYDEWVAGGRLPTDEWIRTRH
jgi:hypothetical protein